MPRLSNKLKKEAALPSDEDVIVAFKSGKDAKGNTLSSITDRHGAHLLVYNQLMIAKHGKVNSPVSGLLKIMFVYGKSERARIILTPLVAGTPNKIRVYAMPGYHEIVTRELSSIVTFWENCYDKGDSSESVFDGFTA